MDEDELMEDDESMDDELDWLADKCYECGGLGDDYYYDEETDELVCACDTCPFNPANYDD